jgi:CrcB protein
MDYVFIALGGGAGALFRYISSSFVNKLLKIQIPAGTLAVNAAGSLLIGVLFSIFEKYKVPAEFRLFLTVGFLGGYTTFSTYSLETSRFFMDGNVKLALINALVGNSVCLAFTLIGMKLGRNF